LDRLDHRYADLAVVSIGFSDSARSRGKMDVEGGERPLVANGKLLGTLSKACIYAHKCLLPLDEGTTSGSLTLTSDKKRSYLINIVVGDDIEWNTQFVSDNLRECTRKHLILLNNMLRISRPRP